MNATLKRLRDAVAGSSGREVEVAPDGTVRPVKEGAEEAKSVTGGDVVPESGRATKLPPRTFGTN